MDQKKIGCFLRSLRLEKGLTQEQLAEKFHVSNRSISRWETGSNLPDISLLVEIADFFDVDVRELINGERKSEDMNKEIKETASLMADYAIAEKTTMLNWIRGISIVGSVLAVGLFVNNMIHFENGNILFLLNCLVTLLVAIASLATCLYTNGLLQKITKNRWLVRIIEAALFLMIGVLGFSIVIPCIVAFGLLAVNQFGNPWINKSGIENYDKTYYLKEYSTEFGSQMLIFPDDTSAMIDPSFESALHTGMFDTDGYVFLQARYSEDDYKLEVERLQNISCRVEDYNYNTENVTDFVDEDIMYDETTFTYPAYISSYGFCDMYEYALVDEENLQITYLLINYPSSAHLPASYLKYTNPLMFVGDHGLEDFSIYSYSFDDGESYQVMSYEDLIR